MNPETAPAASSDVASDVAPGPPRWVFRGDDAALDALATQVATDPTAPVAWPIAPSGPSMDRGDGVLLWRSGRGGGVVAACTVLDEPEAAVGPGGLPRVTVAIRIERAFGRPLAPADLLDEPALRPLAFLDLHDATELRLSPAQQEAFARAVATRDGAGHTVEDEGETVLRVPRRLVPVVTELLERLGAHEPPPAPAVVGDGAPAVDGPPPAPTEPQLRQVETAAAVHGDGAFTVDEVAVTWRTGVGTARSRVERLVEVGLAERAGVRRPAEPQGRPARGRPPILYRLVLTGAGAAPGSDVPEVS